MRLSLLFFFALAILWQNILSREINETKILVSSDSTSNQFFGSDVAISGDYLLVGAKNAKPNSGSAYIFKRAPNNTWVEEAILRPNDSDAYGFGASVEISGDYAFIGAPHTFNSTYSWCGAVYVFKRNGTVWTQIEKLELADQSSQDYMGEDISFNGNYLIVGIWRDDDDGVSSGSACIFELDRNTDTWTRHPKLTASDAEANAQYGYSVAIHGDYALVGAPYSDSPQEDRGSVYVIKRDPITNTWSEESKLTVPDGGTNQMLGWSVALSETRAIASSKNRYVHVFSRTGANWTYEDKIEPNDYFWLDNFGDEIDICGDFIIVGAPTSPPYQDGYSYIFQWDLTAAKWSQRLKLVPSNPQNFLWFGQAVFIDSSDAIAGAIRMQGAHGGTYVFSDYRSKFVNVPPFIDSILDPSAILEDAPTQTIQLTGISDGNPESVQNLSVSATSKNTNLITDVNDNYTPNGLTGSLTYTPKPDSNGTTEIIVRVEDDGGVVNDGVDFTLDTFVVVVTPVNDPPTLDDIPGPLTIEFNSSPQTVQLSGITDGDNEVVQSLTCTATSSNPALIPNPQIYRAGVNTTGSLTYSPVAGVSGSAVITVRISDNGGTANGGVDSVEKKFEIVVKPYINKAPVIDPVSDPAPIIEDAPAQTIQLTGIGDGDSKADQFPLAVTASSSNPALIPNPTVTYTSPGATGKLSYTPVLNASGTAIITVGVKDNGGVENGGINVREITFKVIVTPVNDPPTIDPIPDPAPVTEDAPAQTIQLTGIGDGDSEADQFPFSVTASSSNPALIPNPTVTYTSPGATGKLSYTPVLNATGTAIITVGVKDNGGVENGGINVREITFKVIVTPVNDPPTIDSIPDPAPILEDAPAQTILLTGIGDGDSEADQFPLAVTASSSNPALIPNPTVIYTSPGVTGKLSYTPVLNASGTAVITVGVKDNGGVENSGINVREITFTVNVKSVNDTPTIQPTGNDTIIIDSIYSKALQASDVDLGDTLTWSLMSAPDSMKISPSTGMISWKPLKDDIGTNKIIIIVRDKGGLSDTLPYMLKVYRFINVIGEDTGEPMAEKVDTINTLSSVIIPTYNPVPAGLNKVAFHINDDLDVNNVELSIYSCLGDKVFSKEYSLKSHTGKPSLQWNLRNSNGRKVSEGSYLVLLRVLDSTEGKRVYKSIIGIKK